MVSFSGLEFLFRLLPIFLLLYYITPQRHRESVLLLESLIFYALGEPVYVILLIVTTAFNCYFGMKMWRPGNGLSIYERPNRRRRNFFLCAVGMDVAVLALFKCMAVFVDSALFPLGLSFYIFKMISFQADLYRQEIRERPGWKQAALYFTLFPQVESGPIMRYGEGNFGAPGQCSLEKVEEGLMCFAAGLGMKVLLADRLAILWNDLQMIGFQSISTPLAWLGAAGYSLRLYFDFQGYSLMASGLMVMLGYPYIVNFDHPYASRSIAEFYRRWHMTLGTWFRNYVYIPLGGSRCGRKRLILNLALVWLLTGIWHGNGFNYLIWAGVIGLFIILEKLFYGKYLQKAPAVGNLYVLILIPLTWVIFAITDIKQLGIYFGRLFPFLGGPGIAVNPGDISRYMRDSSAYFIFGIALCVPAVTRFFREHKSHPLMVLLLAAVFWLAVYIQSNSAGNPFMYLNF